MVDPHVQWWRNRLSWLFGGASHNGRRDYNQEFGYPSEVTPQDLWTIYSRGGIASRVIRAFPQATWEEPPVIRDEAGDSTEPKLSDGSKNSSYSAFAKSVGDFLIKTQALRYLERADRLASIGRYGILLMGFRDGMSLSTEMAAGKAELIYLQAYGDMSLQIVDYYRDTSDPKFGRPKAYRVSPGKGMVAEGTPVQSDFTVHASRVLHLAEFLETGEVIGQPRLEPIYNYLLDLQKTVGASAETFWRNSNPGLALSADADAKMEQAEIDSLKEQAQEFEDGMRRILAMRGMTATSLGAGNAVADPANNINALLDLISGATGIPKRILTGSERGELASSQDADTWASRIDERQNNYAGPSILMPFVQKMIDTGNVVRPQGRFWVDWPESNALSPKDQAEVGRIRAESLRSYASVPNAELIVPPQEFRRDFLQLAPESEFEIEEPEDIEETTPPPEGDPEEDDISPTINRLVSLLPAYRPRRLVANATPRTLYVRRDLLNADVVRDHYKAQGLGAMTPADEMHVTIAHSSAAVDWMKVGSDWTSDEKGRLRVVPGGARMHELFGKDKTTLVLLFNCSSLSWRHEDIKNVGASWGFPDYQPHVSLTYSWSGGDFPEPYTGELLFGPEVFEEVSDAWKSTLKENVLRVTEVDRA